jgi:hypothetical protein
MPWTFLNLKQAVRPLVWPAGEGRSRRASHEKYFVDAMIEIQRYVACWQQNQTNLIPHCDTLYKCGLTSFDLKDDLRMPARGAIKGLSVIDKINPETKEEDPNSPDDYCSSIDYDQVDYCKIVAYLKASARSGCCASFCHFFDIPANCLMGKGEIPVPTDEGVSTELEPLPLGYHYPQTSTDYTRRATHGVWAQDRGRFYIAPWIQSTETIIMRWDGLKRIWADGDVVSDEEDSTHTMAVKLLVESKYERFENRDHELAALIEGEFNKALQSLWHDCRAETMVRGCEPSVARAALP